MSADEVVYRESLFDDRYDNISNDREVLWVNDTTGPQYNGQIIFDTSLLTNSGKFLDWGNAYLEIPYQVSLNIGTTAYPGGASAWMFGFKNGYYQIIHSIAVECDGQNVVQQTPYTNMLVNYKVLSTWSQGELQKYGASLGVAPDSPSFRFSTNNPAPSNGMAGYQNNVIYPTSDTITTSFAGYTGEFCFGSFASPDLVNEGYKQRLSLTAYNPTAGYGSVTNVIQSAARAQQCGKSFVSVATGITTLNMVATIRLKDLADFFDKIPLNKSTMRIIINYNSGSYGFAVTTGGAATAAINSGTITQTSGGSFPAMLSSCLVGNPLKGTGAANIATGTAYALQCGVNVAGTNPILSMCRLYCPAYSLNPSYEIKMLDDIPMKTVRYCDILNYNIPNVASNSTINQLLFNSVVNPQFLVVIPFLSDSLNQVTGGSAMKPYQSALCSEPGSTSPFASLSNFNVQVAGLNVFQSYEQYDWEAYMNEVAQLGALNGGMISKLTSGLLSQKLWDGANRYYVVDLRRAKPDSIKMGKSVLLSCQNNTALTLDLFCFVGYEREVALRTEDGKLTQL